MVRWIDRLALRFRSLFQSERVDQSLRRELQDHLDEMTAEHVAAGMTPADARAAALRAFGPVAAVAEACRDTRKVSFVQNLARDLRYTLRTLLRQPMLVGAATLSIGTATAATGVVFTLINELLLTPPTASDPARLVYIGLSRGSHVSYPHWRELAETNVLAGIAGYQVEAEVNWRGADRSLSLMPLLVTANFFDVTGVPVALGRAFTEAEVRAEQQPHVTVITDRFWRLRLGSDPEALGRVLLFNGHQYTIVGILPPGLRSVPGFGISPEVYLPLGRTVMPDLFNPRAAAVELVGRLRDDQSIEQGRAALDTAIRRLNEAHGSEQLGTVRRFAVAQGVGFSFDEIGLLFVVLGVAVALVLAIACANVAGLLLSRATVNRREVAVRAALGASRGRLVQQLLAEAFWISLGGTAAGMLMSQVIAGLLAGIRLPLPIPFELNVDLNLRLMVLALVVLVVTTIFSGLMPALHATRQPLLTDLKRAEPMVGRRWPLRRVLVVGQLAVTVLLLLTAFLFLRNLGRAQSVDLGFDAANTYVAQISFVEGRHTPEMRASLLADAVERLRQRPGIVDASYSHGVPLTMRSGMTTGADLRRTDKPEPFRARYHVNLVGPGYFKTMGVDLLAGREFGPSDRRGAPVVAIINEAFAERHFPGESPLGRHLILPGVDAPYDAEIIGVVGSGRYRTIGEEQMGAIYEPFLQRGNRGRLVHVVVRASELSDAVRLDIERVLTSSDPAAAVDVTPMPAALAFAFLPSQIGAGLLGALGLAALALAVVGLFASIAYAVSRRTAEIGIRIALGATRTAVMRLVLREAALMAGLGIAIGLSTAWFVTAPLGAFLVAGLRAGDPLTFAVTALVLFAASLAAAAGPARRAMRIDPVGALRAE